MNALVFAGVVEEAISAAAGVVEAAEATGNPWALSYALLSVAWVYDDVDPLRALEAGRRGLAVTRDSGNRFNESHLATVLGTLEVKHGNPLEALGYITHAMRSYQDAGSVAFYHSPLANLAVILERLEYFDSAAVLASFAAQSPMATAARPEIAVTIDHLHETLGAQTYEALAREGATMTPAEVAAYAYEQIDRARTALEQLR